MKLVFKEKIYWKEKEHNLELYDAEEKETNDLEPVTQVQAVPFTEDGNVVLYKHIDGYFGLPGGGVEEGENFEQTLKREIYEESACEVLDFGFVAIQIDTAAHRPVPKHYQIRYWAKVKLLDQPINDPCGKALFREVVNLEEAAQKLDWGERGKILLELARKKYENEKQGVFGRPVK